MKTCWLYRLWDVLGTGDTGNAPRVVECHAATCPDCQARAAREARLAERLRVAAEDERQPAPPFLASRISRLAPSQPPATASRGWRPNVGTALIVGTAAIAIVVAVVNRPPPPPIGDAQREVASAASEPVLLPLVGTAVPTPDRLIELGGQLDQPLKAELDAVVQDARTAVQYLASSFLPQP